MSHRMPVVAVVLAALSFVPTANARPDAGWNRAVTAVAITRNARGTHTIRAIVEVTATALTAPVTLDTRVDLRVNGNVVDTTVLDFGASPFDHGCGGCPSGVVCVDGRDAWTGVPTRACAALWCWGVFERELHPGDEITIMLLPATGAASEPDTLDDLVTHIFDAPRAWNRRIASAVLRPGRGDSRTDELVVTVATSAHGVETPNLDAELVVIEDGVERGVVPVTDLATAATVVVPVTGLSEARRIDVLLRPAPGSLPELPEFGGDDDAVVVRCPVDPNGDGATGPDDLLYALSVWGPCAEACRADLDGDEHVGFDDVLLMLGAWGPCFPL